MEETLENQRAIAQQMVNRLLDNAKALKKNTEFIKSLVEPEPIVQPKIYSDIKVINNWNVELIVPKDNETYWNVVVVDRIGLLKRFKECKSQTTFEILLTDLNESFNKLSEVERKLYLE